MFVQAVYLVTLTVVKHYAYGLLESSTTVCVCSCGGWCGVSQHSNTALAGRQQTNRVMLVSAVV